MRIFQIGTDRLPCNSKFGGAIETYVYNISKELAERGLKVHVITLGNKDEIFEENGLIFHSFSLDRSMGKILAKISSFVSSSNRNIIYVSYKILNILNRIRKTYGDIDVIHSHYFTTSLAPLLYKSLYDNSVKLVLHWHNEPKSNWINKFVAKRYDVVAAVSNYVKIAIIQRLGINKVKVAYNAIDTNFFRFNEAWRAEVRENLGFSKDDFVLLFVGRIVKEKGLHHLLKALHEIARYGKDKIKAIIVGPRGHFDREENSQYTIFIEKLLQNLRNQVFYLGKIPREELVKVYCASDAVVVPSIFPDPCPSVILEAMSCNRPIIAYNVGGIPELIRDTEPIFLVNSCKPSDLAKAIIELHDNINRDTLYANLRSIVEKRFSIKTIVDSLMDLYQAR